MSSFFLDSKEKLKGPFRDERRWNFNTATRSLCWGGKVKRQSLWSLKLDHKEKLRRPSRDERHWNS